MHRLVHPPAFGHEPEVDGAERGDHPAGDPGLFRHLADGSHFGRLALFEVPLRQRPDQSTAPIVPRDDGSAMPVNSRDGSVHDQAAGRDFLNTAQSGQRATSGRHGSMLLGPRRARRQLAVAITAGLAVPALARLPLTGKGRAARAPSRSSEIEAGSGAASTWAWLSSIRSAALMPSAVPPSPVAV